MIVKPFITFSLALLTITIGIAAKDPALTYIKLFEGIAKKEMQRSGIPASIKLAQALLESESGKSILAIEGNNHFGIKCGKEWQGKTYFKIDDDADEDGNTIESCFRAFEYAEESYIAHSDFLSDPKKSSRYGFLFDLPQADYKSWASGLRSAGYASDPIYPDKLIRIIEKYELYKLDSDYETYTSSTKKEKNNTNVLKPSPETKDKKQDEVKTSPSRLKVKNEVEFNEVFALKIVEVNDTKALFIPQNMSVEKIAKLVNKKATELMAFNEIMHAPDQIIFEGSIIYTSLKYRDYKGKEYQYEVKKGDSIESIANIFGVRANTLYSLNRIPKSHQPLVGEFINLKVKVDKHKAPKSTKESRTSRVLFTMN